MLSIKRLPFWDQNPDPPDPLKTRTNFFSLFFLGLFFRPLFGRPFSVFRPFSPPFSHPFFSLFLAFLRSFFKPQIHASFQPQIHPFLHLPNLQNYYKTSSFQPSRLFRTVLTFHQFWHRFWHHFGMLFGSSFDTFLPSIFRHPFFRIFPIFGQKWVQK